MIIIQSKGHNLGTYKISLSCYDGKNIKLKMSIADYHIFAQCTIFVQFSFSQTKITSLNIEILF